jgi:hypothetical protein
MFNIFKIFKRKPKQLPLPTYKDMLKLEMDLGLPERYVIEYAGPGWLDPILDGIRKTKMITIRIHAKDLNMTEIDINKIWLKTMDGINFKRMNEADVIEVFFDNLGVGIMIKHRFLNPYMKFSLC